MHAMVRNRPNLGSQIWGNYHPPIWDVEKSFSSTKLKKNLSLNPDLLLNFTTTTTKKKQKNRNKEIRTPAPVLYKYKLHQRLNADPSWYCTDQIGHQCWGILIDNIAVSGRCTQVEPQNHLRYQWVERKKRWSPTTLRVQFFFKEKCNSESTNQGVLTSEKSTKCSENSKVFE